MLARTELSKARSSILKLLSRSGPADGEADTAVLDDELRRLGTAIQDQRTPVPRTWPA